MKTLPTSPYFTIITAVFQLPSQTVIRCKHHLDANYGT